MKYPCISEKSVLETINFYNENPQINSPTIDVMGRTVEQFMENLNKRAQKDKDGKLVRSLVTYRNNKDLLTDESIQVINKLLGDTKIRSKIRIVTDGSYLVNRIWSYVDTENRKVVILPEFDGYSIGVDSSEFYKLSPKKQIDWLFNHFDIIYVQIHFVNTVDAILDEIDWQISLDELDRHFDFDYF